jgi:hypothetical protein
LAIQNTANRHVSNAAAVAAADFSVTLLLWQLLIFPAAAARPDPTPPPFLGEGSTKKKQNRL